MKSPNEKRVEKNEQLIFFKQNYDLQKTEYTLGNYMSENPVENSGIHKKQYTNQKS